MVNERSRPTIGPAVLRASYSTWPLTNGSHLFIGSIHSFDFGHIIIEVRI